MLLGLYGMFATGKTTFMEQIMDDLPDCLPNGRRLIIAYADLANEYEYLPAEESWDIINNHKRWKGSRYEKVDHIDHMIGDRRTLWIVESARYFGGLQEEFATAVAKHGGGLKFIVPYASESIARQFLIDRCNKRNKSFNANYWTTDRLTYEAKARYLNSMNVNYKPIGVEFVTFEVDYERTAWLKMTKLFAHWVGLSTALWYSTAPSIIKKPKSTEQVVQSDVIRKPRVVK